MRGLILAGLAAGLVALSARPSAAQSLTDMVCGRYDSAAKSSDIKTLEAAARNVPAACPQHGLILSRLAALRLKTPKPTHLAGKTAGVKKDAASDDASDMADDNGPDDSAADDTGHDQSLARNDTHAPVMPTTPIDPCSVEAIDALDPSIPQDGPPPGLASAKRADLARRYAARATAFDRCSDLADAREYFAAAVTTDTGSYVALAGKAHFELEQGDLTDSVADDTAAIALRTRAPTDVNPLAAYADRAAAYERQQLYPQEAADLKQIVDHFNDQAHDSLEAFSAYKERLAKAYLHEGDEADAKTTFAVTEESFLDWEDQWFLGRNLLAASQWDAALGRFEKALEGVPAGDAHAAERAQIEVAVGKAYQGRGRDGDIRAAWDAYSAAARDDPRNADARGALTALGQPLAPPTFTEPTMPTAELPAGVSNLATDRPPAFCGQSEKNDYLDTVKADSAQVNANMQTLADYSDQLQRDRARYDANTLLTYAEKIDDLKLFDAEWKRIDDASTALRKQGDGLIAFFNRVRADDSLVVYCKDPSAGH